MLKLSGTDIVEKLLLANFWEFRKSLKFTDATNLFFAIKYPLMCN